MCGSAQKGGINADTIARSGKRCLINKAVRKKGIYREKHRGSAGNDCKSCLSCGGVYLSLQPQQENAAFAE